MEAKLTAHDDVTIITIRGVLNIEHTQPFREICIKHFLKKKIIFNMTSASFVGSTGIQPFLDAVKLVTEENKHGLKIVGVGSEFRRIFQNIESEHLHFFEDESSAIASLSIGSI